MAKTSGLGCQLFSGGYDLTNDIGQIDSIVSDRPALEATGLDKSAHERMPGQYSASMQATGYFNDAALAQHVALRNFPSTDRVVTFALSSFIGAVACSMNAKQISYGWNRGQDGSLGTTVSAQSNGTMLDWGQMLTAGKETDSSGGNNSGVDFGTGSTAFGMVAYLHVFTITGTNLVVTLQESSDNGSGDAFANITGGAFSSVLTASAPTSARIETSLSQTVERYIRAVSSGTFSSATFAVMAKRYAAANAELA